MKKLKVNQSFVLEQKDNVTHIINTEFHADLATGVNNLDQLLRYLLSKDHDIELLKWFINDTIDKIGKE